MKNKILLIIILFTAGSIGLANRAEAGVNWAEVGINGLTCSLCSRTVEKSIERLPFVDSVVMSLETTNARIYFKNGGKIDYPAIAKAVTDSGFSLRVLQVEFSFNDVTVNADGTFTYQNKNYRWMDYKSGSARGKVVLKLVDGTYLPKKEAAEWKKKIELIDQPVKGGIIHVARIS